MRTGGRSLGELGRFSEPALYMLISLAKEPRHGHAMTQDIEAMTGLRLGPGTLYGAMTRLGERGWIEPLPADDRRRPYRLTPEGQTVLRVPGECWCQPAERLQRSR